MREKLEYHSNTAPREPNALERRQEIQSLAADCILSLDPQIISESVRDLLPVIQNDRDIITHKMATYAVFGLITVLNSLDVGTEAKMNLANDAMKHLYFSKDRMEHASEILTRLENSFGTYKKT